MKAIKNHYILLVMLFFAYSMNVYSKIKENVKIEKQRNFISIVGSSNIYPFSIAVSEHFLKEHKNPKPKIESTGSGRGIKFFCEGVGLEYPDIVNVSRQLKINEIEICKQNGINNPIEILLGYGGIILSSSKNSEGIKLSLVDLFMALAQNIPDSSSDNIIINPHKKWNDFNSTLPNIPIKVLGPPKSSGTYDAFISLSLEKGCRTLSWTKNILLKIQQAKKLENKVDEHKFKEKYKLVCKTMRKDGIYVDFPENSQKIIKGIEKDHNIIALVSFDFLHKNNDIIKAIEINGHIPTKESISNRKYLISSPLYMYIKQEHLQASFPISSSIKNYLIQFTQDKSWGHQGYLVNYGLVPPLKRDTVIFGKKTR